MTDAAADRVVPLTEVPDHLVRPFQESEGNPPDIVLVDDGKAAKWVGGCWKR